MTYDQFLRALTIIKDEAFKQNEVDLGWVLQNSISRLYYLGENIDDFETMKKAMGEGSKDD